MTGLVMVTVLAAAAAGQEEPPRRNVAIVLWQGVELLDFAGPGEVFAAAGPGFRTYTVASRAQPIVSQGFVTVTPEYTVADCPAPDIVVLPGGGTSQARQDAALMQWIREVYPRTEVMMSVCTGAFLLAEVGLLDGLEATTFYNAVDGLRARATLSLVHDGRRFVDSDRIVTSTGVSAGIDAALHVLARLAGDERAQATADYMQYRWKPEELEWSGALVREHGLEQADRLLSERQDEAQLREGDTGATRLAQLATRADLHLRHGEAARAEELFQELVTATEADRGERPALHALALRKWAQALCAVDDLVAAEQVLGDSLALLREAEEGEGPAAQLVLAQLVEVTAELGDEEASARYRASLAGTR